MLGECGYTKPTRSGGCGPSGLLGHTDGVSEVERTILSLSTRQEFWNEHGEDPLRSLASLPASIPRFQAQAHKLLAVSLPILNSFKPQLFFLSLNHLPGISSSTCHLSLV